MEFFVKTIGSKGYVDIRFHHDKTDIYIGVLDPGEVRELVDELKKAIDKLESV